MTTPESEFTGEATFCPEDNSLRLYIGRVPRDEYLKLKAEGWRALYKQREAGGGDFVATWTPERRDTALEYAGFIGDEDMGPAERAADRAERFAGYREKRTGEAVGQADRFDAGPAVHGYQSQARADRAVRRHDAVAGRAVDSWSKAEYWQSRTAGVISHALHKAAPGVRLGRIKLLETELRKVGETHSQAVRFLALWSAEGLTHEQALKVAGVNDVHLCRKEGDRPDFPHTPSAWGALNNSHPTLYAPRTLAEVVRAGIGCNTGTIGRCQDWINHLSLRLAYENQMIEAQGGRAALIEMEAGGWIGGRQIRKVNKSNASGLVVSVEVMGTRRGLSRASGYTKEETSAVPVLLNIERAGVDAYTPPTDEDRATLAATLKAEKASRPEKEPCPLINPTEADALKLQAMLNAAERYTRHAGKPSEIIRTTFAQYSGRGVAVIICETGTEHRSHYGRNVTRSDVFKVRTTYGENYCARRVVILTDKPQKGIPWAALAKAKAAAPSAEKMLPRMAELIALVTDLQGYRQKTHAEQALLVDAAYVGWLNVERSTPSWTAEGDKVRKEYAAAGAL